MKYYIREVSKKRNTSRKTSKKRIISRKILRKISRKKTKKRRKRKLHKSKSKINKQLKHNGGGGTLYDKKTAIKLKLNNLKEYIEKVYNIISEICNFYKGTDIHKIHLVDNTMNTTQIEGDNLCSFDFENHFTDIIPVIQETFYRLRNSKQLNAVHLNTEFLNILMDLNTLLVLRYYFLIDNIFSYIIKLYNNLSNLDALPTPDFNTLRENAKVITISEIIKLYKDEYYIKKRYVWTDDNLNKYKGWKNSLPSSSSLGKFPPSLLKSIDEIITQTETKTDINNLQIILDYLLTLIKFINIKVNLSNSKKMSCFEVFLNEDNYNLTEEIINYIKNYDKGKPGGLLIYFKLIKTKLNYLNSITTSKADRTQLIKQINVLIQDHFSN